MNLPYPCVTLVFEMPKYVFLINTNDYAGNYSIDIRAYILGVPHEHCRDNAFIRGIAKKYPEQTKSLSEIYFGDSEAESILYPTLGYENIYGQYVPEDMASEEKLAIYKRRLFDNWQPHYIRAKENVDNGKDEWMHSLKTAQGYMNEAENTTEFRSSYAFNSIAIPFNEQPTQNQIDFMKSQATTFSKEKIFNHKLEILSFELIQIMISETRETI